MGVTLWLLLFVVTVLIITSECVAYAPPSLVKYQHVGDIGFGIQDDFVPAKRSKPSLSIVNPLDVLRQRLLLEMARRQMRETFEQAQLNRKILKSVGKRGKHQQKLQNKEEPFEPVQQNANLRTILNALSIKSHQKDRKSIPYQLTDYYFDDDNNIDAKQSLENPFHFNNNDGLHDTADQNRPFDENQQLPLHADKLHGMQQLHAEQQGKQERLTDGSVFSSRQWDTMADSKTEPDIQQELQQQQRTKIFDDDGNFMAQSFEMNK